MAKIQQADSPSVAAIYAAYQSRDRLASRPQRRLGAASVGQCPRRSWYDFRWAHCAGETKSGQTLRLFETGHLAEQRFIDNLRAIGCTVEPIDPSTGEQWTFTACDGHLVAKIDAAILGLPESPKKWHVGEFKTHSAKSFKEVVAKGVREAKPEHYAQVILGMHLSGMDRAYYLAVNKDTDELYSERFHANAEEAEAILKVAQGIIASGEPPAKPFDSPDKFPCSYCPHRAMCWGTVAPAPAVCSSVNCRNCCHSTAVSGGAWRCERHRKPLSEAEQIAACEDHLFLPGMLAFATVEDADAERNLIYYKSDDGTAWSQGNGSKQAIRSRELTVLPAKLIGVPTTGLVGSVREIMEGMEVDGIEEISE